uniref:Piwi domain-containing protein n=1 Tax=Megaselia scalaris TaxID=36166 RepID=T1GRB8_MEGSC
TVAQCHGADECSNNLTVAVASAIRRYKVEHKDLPNRIILYRDGIGEGALTQLMEVEVKTLVEQLRASYEKSKKISSLLTLSKKINSRLFASNGRNPPPGTVVDDVITLPERYDFYLVSQSVRQGTVSPTGYNVVYSTLGLEPDKLQMLTYKMTHLYYNWSGTTRVPAVCQYAKKLATLAATSLHSIPAQALQKKLYYL